MEKKRIEWIDSLKGIGILLVIVGHSIRDEMRFANSIADFVYSFIYTFHMPLFFMIAGYLFSINYERYVTKRVPEFIWGKVKGYLRPFLSYSLLIYAFYYIVNLIGPIRTMLEKTNLQLIPFGEYFRLGLECNNPYAFHVWYLLILFIISIYAFLFARIESSLGINKGILIATLSFALWNCRIIFASDFSMLVKMTLKFPIYFGIGMYQDKVHRGKLYYGISIMSWVYCGLYVSGFLSGTSGLVWYMKNILLLIASATVADNFFAIAKKVGKRHIISSIGENSLYFYLWHQPFCCGLLGTILYGKLGCSILVTCAVCIVASLVFPSCILWIKRKVTIFREILVFLFGE